MLTARGLQVPSKHQASQKQMWQACSVDYTMQKIKLQTWPVTAPGSCASEGDWSSATRDLVAVVPCWLCWQRGSQLHTALFA
eukprot:scaffold110803_cov15-Tisochrysis_lutea.AAC.1